MPNGSRSLRRAVRRVSIVAKRGKHEAVLAAKDLGAFLLERGLTIEVEQELAVALEAEGVNLEDYAIRSKTRTPIEADLVVVLGGDGTLIHAAGLLGGQGTPVLGINLGTLGFLTEFSREEMLGTVTAALEGTLRVEERAMLQASLMRGRGRLASRHVVNDVVLNKSALARIGLYETRIDGELVTSYRADGVIIATPTGSTAYALSAGGPIVFPTLDCLIIAPICPHRLTHRPIVVPADRRIEVSVASDESEVYLTLDGQQGMPVEPGDRLVVRRSPESLQLVTPPQRNFFDVLRGKLMWGEVEL